MAGRNFSNAGKIYGMRVKPVLLDCNFVVDSTNALGITGLKGPLIANVLMQQTSGGSLPAGSPTLGGSAAFAVLANSAITSTGSTVINGDLGEYPGTSLTGFPPGVVNGVTHMTDSVAQQAQIDATAAYTDLSTRSATSISAVLDGQTLSAGVYTETSGTFNLAASGNGTLTLNGSATDIFVFRCASTLVTGAGGIPTITLTGGALSKNVYWVCGSSATINSGSAGTFRGTIIATASITDTMGGTVDGRLIALTAAITFSAAATVTLSSGSVPTHVGATPGPGVIVVQMQDNYNMSLSGFNQIVSPVSGSALKIDNSALTAGVAYVISTLGNATAAKWLAMGVPAGVTPAVGVSFIAASNGGAGNTLTSRVMTSALAGSGIMTIETVGDPNLSIAPSPYAGQGYGAQFILQCRDYSGTVVAPANGTVISLAFLLNDSPLMNF